MIQQLNESYGQGIDPAQDRPDGPTTGGTALNEFENVVKSEMPTRPLHSKSECASFRGTALNACENVV